MYCISRNRPYIYIYIYICVVDHSVHRASGCSFAILQSPRPLWSFEHSGPMTLCACVDALRSIYIYIYIYT